MNWQNVTVYTILVLCAFFAVYKAKTLFSKKPDKCADCKCECELHPNKPPIDIKECEIKSFEMVYQFLRKTASFPECSSDTMS